MPPWKSNGAPLITTNPPLQLQYQTHEWYCISFVSRFKNKQNKKKKKQIDLLTLALLAY